jgi:hypothetical protein
MVSRRSADHVVAIESGLDANGRIKVIAELAAKLL